MGIPLKNGVCVSCERRAGRSGLACPYCGEQVWRPQWWRACRWSALLLPPILLVCLAVLARPDWLAAIRRLRDVSPVCALLFAIGVGLLLLPPKDDGRLLNSSAELCRHQTHALLGGWAIGLYAIAGTVAATAQPSPAIFLLAGGLALTAFAMPAFLRIHWLSLVAAALLAGAIAASR